ncbi:MAG: sulfotransferase family 2 domain-containing protein [Halioglobus sp.]|nr:sulfotransferase family 2 domain-containing protein [Halioglobus sp.]
MVISHKYRYIFIQTPKTASSTIAIALCNRYDGEEILHKHATFDEYLAQASEAERKYFSFAGVRNPLDVVVSRFELRKSGEINETIEHKRQNQFIQESGGDFGDYFQTFVVEANINVHNPAIVPANWWSKSFQDIDYIYRYENLAEDFSAILKKIGAQQARDLPLSNRTEGKVDFLKYYDRATLEQAYKIFFPYLDCWGYAIPDSIRRQVFAQQQIKEALSSLRTEILDTRPGILKRLLYRQENIIHQKILITLEALCQEN